MNHSQRFFVVLLCAASVTAFSPSIQADMQQGYSNPSAALSAQNDAAKPQSSYGQKIATKAGIGAANLGAAPLELPKNIINTINQGNFLYGFFGGFLKGLVNMIGRTGCGIADLLTFPIPTKPIAYPVYIWDDFDVDTSYGESFRLNTNAPAPQAVNGPLSK